MENAKKIVLGLIGGFVAPTATIVRSASSADHITMTVNITDEDAIGSNFRYEFIKHPEGTLIDENTLAIGDNDLSFTGLVSETRYEIIIYGT